MLRIADPTIFAQYDYAGQERVSKIVRTGTGANPVYERTIYIDGIFEYHILENGTTYEKNYIHIMDDRSRIAMVRIGDQFLDDINEAITYNLENQIGSSTVRLTETGTIIDKEEYYPFGDSSLRTFSKKRYRYVGREKDLESGLYYYGARYYCAWTCRFISVDPLAAQYVQLTPYNYADNNPINDFDIDGMQDNNTEETPKSIEELIIIDPNHTTEPTMPIKTNQIKKKNFSTVEEYKTAKKQNEKDWSKYNSDKKQYDFMKSVKEAIVNPEEGSKMEMTRNAILENQKPVYLSFGAVDGAALAHASVLLFDVSNPNTGESYSYFTSMNIVFDWVKILDLGTKSTQATEELNIEIGTGRYNEEGVFIFNSPTPSPTTEIYPTRMSIVFHEFGHIYDYLTAAKNTNRITPEEKELYYNGLKKREDIAEEFEKEKLRQEYKHLFKK